MTGHQANLLKLKELLAKAEHGAATSELVAQIRDLAAQLFTPDVMAMVEMFVENTLTMARKYETADGAVDSYFAAREAIFEHVKYVEEWRDFPLDDNREDFWSIVDGTLHYASEREALDYRLTAECEDDYAEYGDVLYADEIRHHDKIFRGAVLVAIVVDTNCDGNMFMRILRPENELTTCACGKTVLAGSEQKFVNTPEHQCACVCGQPALYIDDDGSHRCRRCMTERSIARAFQRSNTP